MSTSEQIALARILYCFDFEEVPGESIDTFKPNWIEHRWAPFSVRIKVRSPKHAALIEREGKVAVETKY